MEHAELVVLQKLCEKVSAFLKPDGRVLNGERKVQLKLPGVVEHWFSHTFVELPVTDAPFSPVLISQELYFHTFVSHQQLLGCDLSYCHQYQLELSFFWRVSFLTGTAAYHGENGRR